MQKYQRRLFLVLSCLILSLQALAQNDAPVSILNGEYIKEWLVLGPFSSYDLKKDFLINDGREANAEPKEGDTVTTADGITLTWKLYKSGFPVIDFVDAIGNNQNAAAYAFCYLQSDKSETSQILLGSDDGAAVWVNGKQVHFNSNYRPLFLDNDFFTADLKKGANRCLVKISQNALSWGFALRAFPQNQKIQTTPKFFLSPEVMQNEIALYNIPWKFHPGDNKEWAKRDFDDSSWESVNPELYSDDLPSDRWQGVGWFRLHLEIDSSLINVPLGLTIWQAGSSELYLDGKLLYTFGGSENEWKGLPKPIMFKVNKEHVLSIRYENFSADKFLDAGFSPGFYIRLVNSDLITERNAEYEKFLLTYQTAFTSLMIAIGLLHLILFIFFPALKQNLYFALFLFCYAATIYFDYENSLSNSIGELLFALRMHRGLYVFFIMLQLRFLYSLFYRKLPKQFWLISIVAIISGFIVVIKPVDYFEFFNIIDIIIVIEIFRVIISKLIEKREGTWIIALAFLTYYVFGTFDSLMDAGIIVPFIEMQNPYAFGAIGFFLAMSIYLSRDFARSNKKIAEQEIERKLLEAENIRQSKELEEARQLQLSMLPRELPKLPHLEIGVYMKTATEVGGDYYDFKLHNDGTLTMVIGDATGHGMQAGTMVSATKSLFNALADELEPIQFIKKASHAIKAMGLKKMFMALTIAKIKYHQLQISAAGMPFPLIYRASTKVVEEVVLKGMPLGGSADFPYNDKMLQLNKGDTVLFLSDGFEEMFNPQNEMLGAKQVKLLFGESASGPPAEIIEHLKIAGKKWANGRAQEDDVTFVILKVK